MPTILNGQRTWSLSRDDEGHRTYKITFLVQADSILQGPATIIQTAGLPIFGTYWAVDDDADNWAWCRWEADVKPLVDNEPNLLYEVSFSFSTKPPDEKDRACKETEVEDPLLEPPKINGSFVVYSEEKTFDRFGNPLVNSAFERLRGPQVEFDANRPQIKIDMNVPVLDLALLASLANTVNADPIWGLPPRCVKLSEIEWERRYYGQCYVYYTLHLTFDCRYDTFDRNLLDEGTKVLSGQWDAATGAWLLVNIDGEKPNYLNPQHFIKFTDRLGNPTKVILNGAGLPAGVPLAGTSSTSVYYMCSTTSAMNIAPPNAAVWNAYSFNVKPPPTAWSNAEAYQPGQVVFKDAIPLEPGDGPLYLCTVAVGPTLDQPDVDGAHWQIVPVGPDDLSQVADKGLYNSKTEYRAGDFVTAEEYTGIGNLHVEYYNESDFTLLGVPLTF